MIRRAYGKAHHRITVAEWIRQLPVAGSPAGIKLGEGREIAQCRRWCHPDVDVTYAASFGVHRPSLTVPAPHLGGLTREIAEEFGQGLHHVVGREGASHHGLLWVGFQRNSAAARCRIGDVPTTGCPWRKGRVKSVENLCVAEGRVGCDQSRFSECRRANLR